MGEEVNIRESKFVKEYIECGNAAQAAAAAGYGKKHPAAQGQRLMKDPEIKAAVAKAFAKSEEAAVWNAKKAIEEFEELKQRAMEDGKIGDAIKAVENICKIRGLYAAEKREIEVSQPEITFEQLCIKYNDNLSKRKTRDSTPQISGKE